MSEYQEAWNNEEPVSELGLTVPAWIDQDISPSEIAAIVQGGCASGAYMPAVTYYDAGQTMEKWGDDILNYLDEYADGDDLGTVSLDNFVLDDVWLGLSVHLLSSAVELWASSVIDEIEEKLECVA